MNILKDRVKAKNGILRIQLPEEFKDKIVEIVVKTESEVSKRLLIDKIKIDTTKWKFNRENQ